jgi:hypothetical protein
MRLFHAIADLRFKRSTQGHILFYPLGPMGTGYIIDTDAEFRRIHAAVVKSLMILVAIMMLCPFIGLWLFALVPVVYGGAWLLAKRLTSGLKRSKEKLNRGESITDTVRTFNLKTLVAICLVSVGLTICTLLLLKPSPLFFELVILFIFFALTTGLMIEVKVRQEKH